MKTKQTNKKGKNKKLSQKERIEACQRIIEEIRADPKAMKQIKEWMRKNNGS